MKRIIIGSDHAAFLMKEQVKLFLQANNFEVIDVGTYSEERCDYPQFAKSLSKEVLALKTEGILLCGSGIGVSMAANRFKGIRAALCRSTEDAEMARKHNNANVLCLGARTTSFEMIKLIIDNFLNHSFEEGRHLDRINMFSDQGELL